LIDLGLPDGSGVAVIRALRQKRPESSSIVVTIFDDNEHLFPALKAGAQGYLMKDQTREQEVLLLISKGLTLPMVATLLESSRNITAGYAKKRSIANSIFRRAPKPLSRRAATGCWASSFRYHTTSSRSGQIKPIG